MKADATSLDKDIREAQFRMREKIDCFLQPVSRSFASIVNFSYRSRTSTQLTTDAPMAEKAL